MSERKVKLIYARAINGVIGHKNKIPWHSPEDMVYFKEKTKDSTVIMGRKTWESLSPKFRPLPGRDNIVVTRNPIYEAPGAVIADSLIGAIRLAAPGKSIWIIGGGEIYSQAIDAGFVDEIYETIIQELYEGDTFAPTRPPSYLKEEHNYYAAPGTTGHVAGYPKIIFRVYGCYNHE